MAAILIVDDDAQLRQSFARVLGQEGHAVTTAHSGEGGLSMVRAQEFDLVIMDVRMPGMSGLDTLRSLREIEPKLPVIIMTAFGTTETAIEATKVGAFDYMLKPFDVPEVLSVIDQAVEAGRLMRSRVEMDGIPDTASAEVIIGRSKAMQELYKAIGRVAPTDATVLIRGESGTGKELVARAIYQHSLRADMPFLVINCVAIPETLLESELFGYEKGAFTGAVGRRAGRIEQANGGTVFLDEIGDMPFSIQAKILRLLQEKSFERLGGGESVPVDVRIIAATNRNLESALAESRFREDLYYRLKVVTLWLPPLRERAEDIPLLADYFLGQFSREMEVEDPGIVGLAKDMLSAYSWPGNVRELANSLQKALIFSRGCPIGPEDVAQAISAEAPLASTGADPSNEAVRQWVRNGLALEGTQNMFEAFMDQFASIVISEALSLTGGNRTRAARLLGLSRPTLLSRIDKYRLKIEASISSTEC